LLRHGIVADHFLQQKYEVRLARPHYSFGNVHNSTFAAGVPGKL
jgi:hypothetical protein